MIISFVQAIFCVTYYSVTIPIYNSFLMVGYSTIYTTLPIFCLVLDEDVDMRRVLQFPALYITIQKGRSLNLKSFLTWTFKSIYQVSSAFTDIFAVGLRYYVHCSDLVFISIRQHSLDHFQRPDYD